MLLLFDNKIASPKLIIRIINYWFITFFSFFTLLAWSDSKTNYAIIITIDGLRPDAITNANTPFTISLIKQGSYTLDARTNDPPNTLSSHTSLVSGLKPNRHKITYNYWNHELGYVNVNTIFNIAKNKGMKTAFFVGKDKLEYLAKPGVLNYFESTGKAPTSVEEITSRFTSYFKMEKPNLTLIHYPEPDMSGHESGWMTEDYLIALENVDRAIASIIESIRKEGIYDETTIIITSDHGGKDKSHEGIHKENMKIPWIAIGSGVKVDYKIRNKVFIHDTAPTVLLALGIEVPEDWDGKPIKEIFANGRYKAIENFN
ncbi:ectonucleotide pyrophosphatase/phosphodiesterase [Desulfobacterota bacterium AH_259_B03_O07]|nr:ectonucleotide pyrophosphatase/phosphodiesterase [Desulfobacterota bacterium AH_259_B03_O07]